MRVSKLWKFTTTVQNYYHLSYQCETYESIVKYKFSMNYLRVKWKSLSAQKQQSFGCCLRKKENSEDSSN